jgi:hypothetical protein
MQATLGELAIPARGLECEKRMIPSHGGKIHQAHFKLFRLVEDVDQPQILKIPVFMFIRSGDHEHIACSEFP